MRYDTPLTPEQIKTLRKQPAPGLRKDLICGDCGDKLLLRTGKFGRFYGCVNYSKDPFCRGSLNAAPDGTPLGKAASQDVRRSRQRFIVAFEHVKKHEWSSRTLIDLQFSVGSVGYLSKEECEEAVGILLESSPTVADILALYPLTDPVVPKSRWEILMDPFDLFEEPLKSGCKGPP